MDGVIQNVAHIHVVISSCQKHQSEIPTMNILEIPTMNILEIVSAMLSLRFTIFCYHFVEIYDRMCTPLQGPSSAISQKRKHVSKIATIIT